MERMSRIWASMLTTFADDLMDGKVVHGAADRAILGAMVKETVERCVALEAHSLSAEDVEALRLVPSALEAVFARAQIEAAVNGTPDPTRVNIDKVLALLDRLLAGVRK